MNSSIFRNSKGRRTATTTMEVVVAIALLAVAATLVGRFVGQVKQGLRDRELTARFEWELLNARERIGSWTADRITLERIQQLPISDALASRLKNARLAAAVQNIETPLPALQVTLGLEGELNGQAIQPAVLTFWVPSTTAGEP
jgi:hypothetical protein